MHIFLLPLQLFDKRLDVVARVSPGATENGNDLVAPHPLVPALVLLVNAELRVGHLCDAAAVGNKQTVVFQIVIAEPAGNVQHVGNAFSGHIAEPLIVAAIQVPFRQIFRPDLCAVMTGKQSAVLVGNIADMPAYALIVPEGIKCVFESV